MPRGVVKGPQIRRMETIWKSMENIYKTEIVMYHLNPNHKGLWRAQSGWAKLMGWRGDKYDCPTWWPYPEWAMTEGWQRHTKNYTPPHFAGYDTVHRYQFRHKNTKIDDDKSEKEWSDETKRLIQKEYKSTYLGGFNLFQMPLNCGMICISDICVGINFAEKGLGYLLCEMAERFVIDSDHHCSIGTGIYHDGYDEKSTPIAHILKVRGWDKVGEFYNNNSGNIVATWQKRTSESPEYPEEDDWDEEDW